MYDLYATGATLEEVGARFGLTRERVRQVFSEAGLPTRSITETLSLRRDRTVRRRSKEICVAFSRSRDVADVAQRLGIPRAIVQEVVEAHFTASPRRRHPKATTPKYPTEVLIACLQEASAAVDGPLTASAYRHYADARQREDGRSWPATPTYVNRFGSWGGAMAQAGLPVVSRGRSGRRFSEEDCIRALREVARALEEVPTIAAYTKAARASHGRLPSAITITNRLGNWTKALTKARL